MKRSLRSEDKSIYLAFALSPSITFESILDRQSSQNRQFHFQLCKGNSIIQESPSFGIHSMLRQSQHYLYLSLPQYAQKLSQTYTIKLIDETEEQNKALFEQKINLDHYINEHNTQQRDFWTQIYKASNQTQKIMIKQRTFLKRTRFELDDIINSSQTGQQLDIVDIPTHSSTNQRASKFALDRRKCKSHQSSSLNNLISPMRLDTISEEDSNAPFTDRKQGQFMGENKARRQRMSIPLIKSDDFEHQLQKRSTWIQKNDNFDDEFLTAFSHCTNQERSNGNKRDTNSPQSNFLQLYIKSTTQSQISQKGSKFSKYTKDSEKQTQDNQISFLEKSSLLLDMDQSELSISVDQQIYFKLKWIILVIVILALAVLASLSTDSFNISDDKKIITKTHKRNKQNSKRKNHKNNNRSQRKLLHP